MGASLFTSPPNYATAYIYRGMKNVCEINIEGRNTFDCSRIEISAPSVNVDSSRVSWTNDQTIS